MEISRRYLLISAGASVGAAAVAVAVPFAVPPQARVFVHWHKSLTVRAVQNNVSVNMAMIGSRPVI